MILEFYDVRGKEINGNPWIKSSEEAKIIQCYGMFLFDDDRYNYYHYAKTNYSGWKFYRVSKV